MSEYETINGVRVPFGLSLLEPREHLDSAVVDVKNGSVIYDEELLIDGYMEMGMTWEEAMDWMCYNTDGNGYFYISSHSKPRVKRYCCEDSEDSEDSDEE